MCLTVGGDMNYSEKWEVKQELGEGGQGKVYRVFNKAVDLDLQEKIVKSGLVLEHDELGIHLAAQRKPNGNLRQRCRANGCITAYDDALAVCATDTNRAFTDPGEHGVGIGRVKPL